MKDAGCVLVHYGIESANRDVLDRTNKKLDLHKAVQGVRLTKKMGIQTACFFMFGLPGEKPEQFENTLELARDLNPTYASFHFAIPFPGTRLYEEYLEKSGLPGGAWPATFFNEWPPQQISAYIKRAILRFYLTPKRMELREFTNRLSNLPLKLAYFKSIVGSPSA